MRLYLAVAVLMLAFVAYTEAQDDTNLREKITTFTSLMGENVKNWAERVQTGFEEFRNSEAAQRHTAKINEQWEKFVGYFKPAQ